jgi:hypothetical protein
VTIKDRSKSTLFCSKKKKSGFMDCRVILCVTRVSGGGAFMVCNVRHITKHTRANYVKEYENKKKFE